MLSLLHIAKHSNRRCKRHENSDEQRVIEVRGQKVEILRWHHSIEVEVRSLPAEGERQAAGLQVGGRAHDMSHAARQGVVVGQGAERHQRDEGGVAHQPFGFLYNSPESKK